MTLRPANDVADEIIAANPGLRAYRDTFIACFIAREREVMAACKAIATDRFDVPPEHDSEPVEVHNGWEMCARTIAARIAALGTGEETT